MPTRPRARKPTVSAHPHENSLASIMLSAAIDAADRSMSQMGREMGYTNRATLSHMASGMSPIPIGSAERIARVAGLDEGVFTMAVLHQRHAEAATLLLTESPQGTSMLFDAALLASLRVRLRAQEPGLAKTLSGHLGKPFPWDGMAQILSAI